MKIWKKVAVLFSLLFCFAATGCASGQAGLQPTNPIPAVQVPDAWLDDENGEIEVKCDFCNKIRIIKKEEIK